MAPLAGIEPTTIGLEVRCSVLLSYRGGITLLKNHLQKAVANNQSEKQKPKINS